MREPESSELEQVKDLLVAFTAVIVLVFLASFGLVLLYFGCYDGAAYFFVTSLIPVWFAWPRRKRY